MSTGLFSMKPSRWRRPAAALAALAALLTTPARALDIDLGAAGGYAAFVFEDLSALVSSAGRVAVGGNFSVRGGQNGGDGGVVETSGATNIKLLGTITVDARAPKGRTGSLYIDPENDFTISGTGTPNADGPTIGGLVQTANTRILSQGGSCTSSPMP